MTQNRKGYNKHATKVNKPKGKKCGVIYTSPYKVAERAANWAKLYALYNFTSHSLQPLPLSSVTEDIIRQRNVLTKKLKVAITEDLAAYAKKCIIAEKSV